jgi:uncharacterized protein (TIGR03083 family)
MLDKGTYLASIRRDVPLLVTAARRDLAVPIPSCPGWSMATLVAHLGEVERFWAHVVEQRAQSQIDFPDAELGVPERERSWYAAALEGNADLAALPPGLIPWFEQSAARLVEVFERTDPEEIVWHWSDDNRGITHMRNQAMEHTFHRWDAENAVGVTTEFDPAIAVDAIDQHFEVQIGARRYWNAFARGAGERYHLHRTDGDGEWTIQFDGDAYSVTRAHAKGDVAVRGTAEDLALWLWGRPTRDRLEVLGDRAVFERYTQLVPTG